MYIPEFWVGFVAGVAVATVLIVSWALWHGKDNKK